MAKKGLSIGLEIEDRLEDSLDQLGGTFREEGLSVGFSALRIQGESIEMTIDPGDLEQLGCLGRGACSTVYKCRHRLTGAYYAVKMFSVYDKERRKQLHKEIKTLSSVECESLITFLGAFHKEGSIGVILEYMDRGSLEFIMEPSVRLTDLAMAAISYQIIWGLAYLHFDNLLHRDIKPGNVLINSRGQVKLSDFGIARELDHSDAFSTTSIGTFRYMSTERLSGEDYNASSDIWSVAVMVIELWCKRYPFIDSCSSPIHLSERILEVQRQGFESILPDSCSAAMESFLLQTLAADPAQKMKAGQFIDHPWFTKHGLTSPETAQVHVMSWLRDNDENSASSKRSKTSRGAKKSSKKGDSDDEDNKYGSDFDDYTG